MTNNLHYKCQTSSHSVPLVSNGIQKNKSTWSFQTAIAKTSQDESEVWLSPFPPRFEVRKWYDALHSSAVLVPPFPDLSSTLQRRLSVLHGQGRFTLEQKWSVPLEQGFLSIFSPKLCGVYAHPALLARQNILVLGFNRYDWRNVTWIGSDIPPSLTYRHFERRVTLDGSRSLRLGVLRLHLT